MLKVKKGRTALKTRFKAGCMFLQNPVEWQILSGTLSTLHICIVLQDHQLKCFVATVKLQQRG